MASTPASEIKPSRKQDDDLLDFQDNFSKRLEAFMDGKFMAVFMACLTIFSLFGEDVRVGFFQKTHDPIFYSLFCISFVLFASELVILSVVQLDYKWGFYFWLDAFATVSMVSDIKWIMNWLASLFEYDSFGGLNSSTHGESIASRAGSRAGRVARLVRLIGLIRVIRLYKTMSLTQESYAEERKKEQAREALNAKQAALIRVEARQLGRQVTDKITRLVIVGILIILVVLPFLQKGVTRDNSRYYGLKNIFWFGRNVCSQTYPQRILSSSSSSQRADPDDNTCFTKGSDTAWHWTIVRYSEVTDESNSSALLWLHVPNCEHGGKLMDIPQVTLRKRNSTLIWRQDDDCAGVENDNCKWRDSEIDLVAYEEDNVISYAKFQVQSKKQYEAYMGITTTVFVILMLAVLITVFSRDIQILVIAPIEHMMNMVKQLANDPLKKLEVTTHNVYEEFGETRKSMGKNDVPLLATSSLEITIHKIASLLQIGFGETGIEVISSNMNCGHGDLNIMVPGKKVNVVFGYCNIRQFFDATQILQDIDERLKAGEMTNKALVAFLKCIAEIWRHPDVLDYERDPRTLDRLGEKYKLRIGYALHVGWAIEGAVGSDYKIDASYVSPHVKVTEKLQEATKYYKTHLLMTEPFYVMLSVKAKESIRKIDLIKFQVEDLHPVGLFTFDIDEIIDIEIPKETERNIGDAMIPHDILHTPLDHLYGKGAEYMFLIDEDITGLQKKIITHDLFTEYRCGLAHYVTGNWSQAKEHFNRCLNILPRDGPTTAILSFIESTNYVAPNEWNGFRLIDDIATIPK